MEKQKTLFRIYPVLKGRLLQLSTVKLLGLAYLMNISIAVFFGYVLFPDATAGPEESSPGFAFVAGVLAAPLIEAYLVQHLIIFYSKKWLKHYWIGMMLSTLAFSALHHYSLPYMAKTLFTGAVYSVVYATSAIHNRNAVWHVAIVHGLHNLTGFCLHYIFNL